MWQNNDAFALFQTSDINSKSIFNIGNIYESGRIADFSSSDFTPSGGAGYYAFCPQGFTASDNKIFTYTIPDNVYTQYENNNTSLLQESMIMIVTGSSYDIGNGIDFNHKTALLRFVITNLKGNEITVNSLKLFTEDLNCFVREFSYDVETGSVTVGGKSTSVSLNFGDGIKLEANDSSKNILKAYTLTIPADNILLTRMQRLLHLK